VYDFVMSSSIGFIRYGYAYLRESPIPLISPFTKLHFRIVVFPIFPSEVWNFCSVIPLVQGTLSTHFSFYGRVA